MKRILIIEPEMMHYRVPFYARLHAELKYRQIALQVAYSELDSEGRTRRVTANLPAEYGTKVRAFRCAKGIVFQPLLLQAARADLVVVDQANKFLLNHLLVLESRMGLKRVAFWGHGRCHHSSPLSEWYKRKTLNWVDWWFAYTYITTDYLIQAGVDRSKITTVDNCIDTQDLRAELAKISTAELQKERARLGIEAQARVAVFCGTLHGLKAVPLLLEAAELIRVRVPQFHLIVVGGGTPSVGPYAESLRRDWIHFVGPCFGVQKARMLKLAEVFLLPGVVGLAILDAFVAALPLITTRNPSHCPEIGYLEPESNGLMTAANATDYADAIVGLLNDPQRLRAMQTAAAETGAKYTIDRMVANFCDGIERCLDEEVPVRNGAETPIDHKLG